MKKKPEESSEATEPKEDIAQPEKEIIKGSKFGIKFTHLIIDEPIEKVKLSRAKSVIGFFDKTPIPKGPGDVFCPHFWELKYATGCKYDCAWCYLNGTMRMRTNKDKVWIGKAPYPKPLKMIVEAVEEALDKIDQPTLFNAGEVSDALVFQDILCNTIFPLFKKYKDKGHKLLLLTKDDSLSWVSNAGIEGREFIIVAHSVNAAEVSNRWEIKAPHPWNRLEASKQAANRGFETRLRIDPMVGVENWKDGYRELCEKIMEMNPDASVITIGSLRGLQSTINEVNRLMKDNTWIPYLTKQKEKSNWGLKVPKEQRYEMYKFLVGTLRGLGYKGHIALCKETLGAWDAAGLDRNKAVCNCMYTQAPPEQEEEEP